MSIDSSEITRLRALCASRKFGCTNDCRYLPTGPDEICTHGVCDCSMGGAARHDLARAWNALPAALDEIERLHEAYRKIQCEYPGLTAMLDEVKYDNARLRKINDEAIRLLHMLDRAEARHPDVASFLDGLDPDAGLK